MKRNTSDNTWWQCLIAHTHTLYHTCTWAIQNIVPCTCLRKVNYHHQLLVVIPLTTKGWASSIMVQLVHILSLPTHSDLTTSGVPSILIFSYLYLYRNNNFFLWRMYISCIHATDFNWTNTWNKILTVERGRNVQDKIWWILTQ